MRKKSVNMKTRKYQKFRKVNKFLFGFVVLLFGVVIVLAGMEIMEIGERNELKFEESKVGYSPENVLQNEVRPANYFPERINEVFTHEAPYIHGEIIVLFKPGKEHIEKSGIVPKTHG